MQIEIDDDLKEAFQEFTSMQLGAKEIPYFMDFFVWMGVAAVRAA